MPQAPLKRPGGPSQEASDSSTATKKIKKEDPDGVEDTIFEAARRRHQEHTGQSSQEDGGAEPPGVETHLEWEKRWDAVYPRDIVRAVGAVRKRSTRPSAPARAAVYVLTHLVYGQYGGDNEHAILGTYSTAASANEQAMVFFQEEHPEWLHHIVKGSMTEMGYDGACSAGEVDAAGCLSMHARDKFEKVSVFVLEQIVKD